MVLVLSHNYFYFNQIQQNRGYLSPVGEASGSNYEALGRNTVHVYSTMQNRDLFGDRSNYEALGQETVHEYSTMHIRDLN